MHGRSWALVGIGITWIWVMLVAGAGEVAAQGKIVIYAAEDEKTTNALTTQFTDETKIGTEVIRIPAAGTLATRIRAEKAAPKADIFIGGSGEFHEPLAAEGLVLPYRSPVVAQAKIDPVFVSRARLSMANCRSYLTSLMVDSGGTLFGGATSPRTGYV